MEDVILKIIVVSIVCSVISVSTIFSILYAFYGKRLIDKEEDNHIVSTPGARFETKVGKGAVVKRYKK